MSTPERGLGAGVAAACGQDPEQDDPIDDTDSTTKPDLAPVLPELVPRSPSSQIIGTPFTTETRFEYPFPDTSSPSDASSMVLSSSFPSLSASASFHSLIASSSSPSITTQFPPTFPVPAYSSTHPKLRIPDPPVPPGLIKKRQRWSLGLLRRRSSSHESQSSEGTSSTGTTCSTPAPASPAPGSVGGMRNMRASSDPRVHQVTSVLGDTESHPPTHAETPP
ncbi:hypothetical protein D9615_000909 [Tricholomella constricta]|uniref:Uncharacterized protein n=1 Tax=Tricholomella constricta TaxID=117010 RepID=A0A8H5HKT7_9AGAR|nr:hypothetical protein D9615_000909 [Tricholomella constricta]